MKSNILLKIIVAVIFILAIVGFSMVVTAGEDASADMASAASFMVNVAIILLIISAALAVLFSIFSVLKSPAALKKTLLGLVIFGVLFAISYFTADNSAIFDANKEQLVEQGSTSQWSGAGLNLSIILLLIGGVIFVFDMLKSLIKS